MGAKQQYWMLKCTIYQNRGSLAGARGCHPLLTQICSFPITRFWQRASLLSSLPIHRQHLRVFVVQNPPLTWRELLPLTGLW